MKSDMIKEGSPSNTPHRNMIKNPLAVGKMMVAPPFLPPQYKMGLRFLTFGVIFDTFFENLFPRGSLSFKNFLVKKFFLVGDFPLRQVLLLTRGRLAHFSQHIISQEVRRQYLNPISPANILVQVNLPFLFMLTSKHFRRAVFP